MLLVATVAAVAETAVEAMQLLLLEHPVKATTVVKAIQGKSVSCMAAVVAARQRLDQAGTPAEQRQTEAQALPCLEPPTRAEAEAEIMVLLPQNRRVGLVVVDAAGTAQVAPELLEQMERAEAAAAAATMEPPEAQVERAETEPW